MMKKIFLFLLCALLLVGVTACGEVKEADLPEVGYDFDGKGRIFLKEASVTDGVATFVIENQDKTWIISEESAVAYTIYDKKGNELKSDSTYIGMIRCGETATITIELPKKTAKLEFGALATEYWSDWG